jgi:hypothetical protein
LKVSLTGRALMVKPLKAQIDEEASHFSPVAAGMSYRDAIRMLEKPERAGVSPPPPPPQQQPVQQ